MDTTGPRHQHTRALPFLRYKEFPQLLELCASSSLRLNLTTNGTWYRKGPVEWAYLILPVASDIKISWNGATAKTNEAIMTSRGGESNWSNRFPKLQQFLDVRETMPDCKATVTLQVTFMEDNFREFPELVSIAARLGVDRVKGHQLWVTYEELAGQDMRRSADSRRRWNAIVDECRKVWRMPRESLARECRVPSAECRKVWRMPVSAT